MYLLQLFFQEASQSFFQGEDWPGVGTYKKSDGSVFNARKVVEEEARARHAAELKQDPTYVPEVSYTRNVIDLYI